MMERKLILTTKTTEFDDKITPVEIECSPRPPLDLTSSNNNSAWYCAPLRCDLRLERVCLSGELRAMIGFAEEEEPRTIVWNKEAAIIEMIHAFNLRELADLVESALQRLDSGCELKFFKQKPASMEGDEEKDDKEEEKWPQLKFITGTKHMKISANFGLAFGFCRTEFEPMMEYSNLSKPHLKLWVPQGGGPFVRFDALEEGLENDALFDVEGHLRPFAYLTQLDLFNDDLLGQHGWTRDFVTIEFNNQPLRFTKLPNRKLFGVHLSICYADGSAMQADSDALSLVVELLFRKRLILALDNNGTVGWRN